MPRVHERATFDPCTRPRYVDLNRGGGYVPYVPQPAAAASYGAVAPQPWPASSWIAVSSVSGLLVHA